MDFIGLISAFEAELRLAVFFFMLSIMATWELVAPRRTLTQSKARRWLNNLGLVAVNSLLLRILFPAATAGFAFYAARNQIGLLNSIEIADWISIIIALIFLDLSIYIQHVVFHKIPFLWRFHHIHHLDLDFDVTTGLRFHPVEMLLSMLIKILIVLLMGVPVVAAMLFEVILSTAALFSHGNVTLPGKIDFVLRLMLVTPDMHRIHHSCEREETDSNYGFNLSLWDRIFKTYRERPKKGQIEMIIGQENWRDPKQCIPLISILKAPFIKTD